MSEQIICSICFDLLGWSVGEMEETLESVVIVNCGHCFHKPCIDAAFSANIDLNRPPTTCPVCSRATPNTGHEHPSTAYQRLFFSMEEARTPGVPIGGIPPATNATHPSISTTAANSSGLATIDIRRFPQAIPSPRSAAVFRIASEVREFSGDLPRLTKEYLETCERGCASEDTQRLMMQRGEVMRKRVDEVLAVTQAWKGEGSVRRSLNTFQNTLLPIRTTLHQTIDLLNTHVELSTQNRVDRTLLIRLTNQMKHLEQSRDQANNARARAIEAERAEMRRRVDALREELKESDIYNVGLQARLDEARGTRTDLEQELLQMRDMALDDEAQMQDLVERLNADQARAVNQDESMRAKDTLIADLKIRLQAAEAGLQGLTDEANERTAATAAPRGLARLLNGLNPARPAPLQASNASNANANENDSAVASSSAQPTTTLRKALTKKKSRVPPTESADPSEPEIENETDNALKLDAQDTDTERRISSNARITRSRASSANAENVMPVPVAGADGVDATANAQPHASSSSSTSGPNAASSSSTDAPLLGRRKTVLRQLRDHVSRGGAAETTEKLKRKHEPTTQENEQEEGSSSKKSNRVR